MGELIAVAVVIGIGVLLAWPVLASMRRRRSPHDQQPVTKDRPVPSADPDRPVPGSRPYRRRQGKP